ncbi:hypothetical protein GMI69_10085 [Eggerthellaceae bacterium zg-887]|uniref:hypothetical protein n=1 Tax=Xiamenia xianingshaonis TaxID=2682776 RepID=UPI0014092193|nr:hypothetical protein [Xiamenia xianingshaonis]NHM16983.1 hypothetical protein [Xiamenia xianingshaonis]
MPCRPEHAKAKYVAENDKTAADAISTFLFDVSGALVAAAVAYYLCKRFGYLKEK